MSGNMYYQTFSNQPQKGAQTKEKNHHKAHKGNTPERIKAWDTLRKYIRDF